MVPFPTLRRALLACAILLSAGQAFADPPNPPPMPPPPPGMHGGAMGPGPHESPMLRHADELGLSAAQVESIKGLEAAARPSVEKMHRDIGEQMEALREVKPGDAAYATTVEKAAQAIGDLTRQSIVQASQLRAQQWNVLTADQRTKLAAIEAKWREHERRHDHGPGPGPGPGPGHAPPPPPPSAN